MPRTWISTSLATALVAVVAALALREIAQPRPRNVILLSIESTQAEMISPDITPNLWRVAEQGMRFTQYRGVSGWTATNAISFLTGLSPFEHGIHTRDQDLPNDWPLPLKDLAAAGWRTEALQPFMALGVFASSGLKIEPFADLFPWLAQRAGEKQPFLLWYHYLNTHLPYAPSAAFMPDWESLLPPGDEAARERVRTVMTAPTIPAGTVQFEASDRPAIRALYTAGFRDFDIWFRDFWRFFQDSGLSETTMLIVTADHGDEQLDHGNRVGHASTTHDGHLYEELVHIPLILWVPGGKGGSARQAVDDRLADHLDLMPTIFAWLGRRPSRDLAGQNLLAPARKSAWTGATSKAGFGEPDPQHLEHYVFARLEPPWKLLLFQDSGVTTRTELFDLQHDPGEQDNRAAAEPQIVARLATPLLADIAAMRVARHESVPAAPGAGTPRWVFPAQGGAYGYDELSGRFRLQWTGDPQGRYRIDYEAGSGATAIAGHIDAEGVVKDFGAIDRHYWETWILPYKTFRLRVGPEGRDDAWSDWITLEARP